jgi:hypothetical protein
VTLGNTPAPETASLAPLSHHTAVFLVMQHSFDFWRMGDGTEDALKALVSGALNARERAIRAEYDEAWRHAIAETFTDEVAADLYESAHVRALVRTEPSGGGVAS